MDVTDAVLGRLATKVIDILRGEHEPTFAPHMDMGDSIITINVNKAVLTGKRLKQKMAYHHSRCPGGPTAVSYRDLMANSSERTVEKAVCGILSHASLGRAQFKKLHTYVGAGRPCADQLLIPYEVAQVA